MAHTFIPIKMALIPWQTKKYVPTFWSALFSNDGVKDEDGKYTTEPTYLLLDGRNDKGELVHPISVLLSWTQWSEKPNEVVQSLLDDAIEYTSAELKSLNSDINSIWYVNKEALI
jgi:hypothetical protein